MTPAPGAHAGTPGAPSTATGTDDTMLASLRRWNLGLTVLHAAQAVLVLLLAGDFAISVVETFPEGPPGTTPPAGEALFDVRIGYAVAAFLLLAALDHGLTATVARAVYERDLRAGINRFRWVEYSLSATLMILLIASYNGITEVSAVIAIAGANVAMILFGWVQEAVNPPGEPTRTMLPFWAGIAVDALDQRSGATAALLHGLLFGRLAPRSRERRQISVPTLVVSHPRDPLHRTSDADLVASEIPGAELVRARGVLEAAHADLRAKFGRGGESPYLEEYMTEDAEIIIVGMGTLALPVRVAIRRMREAGRKIGFVRVKFFRPFPTEEIQQVLGGRKAICVIDRDYSFGSPSFAGV